MRLHSNAKTTPISRALLVQRVLREHWGVEDTADAFGVSTRTVCKWLARYRAEGRRGLQDRSSRPHRMPHRTPERLERAIERLRKRRWLGWRIAGQLKMAVSTVSAVLRRLGLGRLPSAHSEAPVHRYEWERPGDLLHIDIKKFGRFREVGHRITGKQHSRSHGMGSEFAYVCVDDATRLAYVEILANERAVTAEGFLRRAVAWFARRRIRVRRVMTDNGSGPIAATSSRFVTCERDPIPRAPTGRQNASSRHSNASGPTASSTRPPPADDEPSRPG